MQQSTDLIHFEKVDDSRFSLNHLRPRHGSVLHITGEEYERLVAFYSAETAVQI